MFIRMHHENAITPLNSSDWLTMTLNPTLLSDLKAVYERFYTKWRASLTVERISELLLRLYQNTLGVARGQLLYAQREVNFRVMMRAACETTSESNCILWTTHEDVGQKSKKGACGANHIADWSASVLYPSKASHAPTTSATRRLLAFLLEYGYDDGDDDERLTGCDIIACFVGAHHEMALVLLTGLLAIWSARPSNRTQATGYIHGGRNSASLFSISESVSSVAWSLAWTSDPQCKGPFCECESQLARRATFLRQPEQRLFVRAYLIATKALPIDLVNYIELF